MPAKCPLCGNPADAAHQPFCGQGCRDRDLLRWLDEGYRLPGRRADHDMPGNGLDDGLADGPDRGVDKADGAD